MLQSLFAACLKYASTPFCSSFVSFSLSLFRFPSLTVFAGFNRKKIGRERGRKPNAYHQYDETCMEQVNDAGRLFFETDLNDIRNDKQKCKVSDLLSPFTFCLSSFISATLKMDFQTTGTNSTVI